jgi:hypothetical protein
VLAQLRIAGFGFVSAGNVLQYVQAACVGAPSSACKALNARASRSRFSGTQIDPEQTVPVRVINGLLARMQISCRSGQIPSA